MDKHTELTDVIKVSKIRPKMEHLLCDDACSHLSLLLDKSGLQRKTYFWKYLSFTIKASTQIREHSVVCKIEGRELFWISMDSDSATLNHPPVLLGAQVALFYMKDVY